MAEGLSFCVNISMLFSELPFLDRPAAVATCGFDAIECWWPFAEAVPGNDEVDAFVSAVRQANIDLVALNRFAGDRASGDRGVVSLPGREEEFRGSVAVLARIAERTGCKKFNAPYGNRLNGYAGGVQDETAVRNLTFVAQTVKSLGGSVLIEPLTWGENGTYPLRTADDVFAVMDRVIDNGCDNVRLLADVYHLAGNGDDPITVFRQHLKRVGHVQVADLPGRHEPGTGDLDFLEVFRALVSGCYRGYVGLEYEPLARSVDSFGWMPPAWGKSQSEGVREEESHSA